MALSVLFLAVFLSVASLASARQVCNRKDCPAIQCADPDFKVDPCCGDCSRSQCKFNGARLDFSAHITAWYTTPCTRCTCSSQGETVCTNTTCPSMSTACESLGYTIIAPSEKECCPSCNYGISSSSCGLVRSSRRIIKVTTESDQECSTEVIFHKCDKDMPFAIGGSEYKCIPNVGKRSVTMTSSNCKDVKNIVVEDIIDCSIKVDSRHKIYRS